MKIYLDEKGTIVIDGEGTALLSDSQLTDENSIAQIIDNKLPNNMNIMLTKFNIISGNDKNKKIEMYNKFLDNGTLFDNRE
jgi:hypothetical protein